MMVVICHITLAVTAKHPDVLGAWLPIVLDFGRYGVQIFFVLSGFVIAHSVQGGDYSPAYLGRFIARRFVRLDLPLWSIIALEIFLLWLSGQVMSAYERPLPSPGQTLANMFYVQVFTGHEHIIDVFWSLCYEVQFYLVFVSVLVALRALESWTQCPKWISPALIALSFAVSLLIYVGVVPSPHAGLFVDRWWQFALGVVTYYSYLRGLADYAKPVLIANVVVIAVAVGFADGEYRVISLVVSAMTSALIVLMPRLPAVDQWLSSASLQFFGRISYSLYLIHLSIGWRVVVVLRELSGDAYSWPLAVIAFAVGIGASVVAAWVLWYLVERPAITVARQIRLPVLHRSTS
jgi:peptidoglycan/LPS O-acetylase OafA/YrhL